MSLNKPIQLYDDQPDCMDLLQQKNQTVALLSGKSVTQMGLYQQCLNQQGFKYGFLNFINTTTNAFIGVQMGLCVPQICKPQQIESLAQMAFAQIHYPVSGKFIQNPQEYYPQFGIEFWITISLLSIYALLVLVSTFSQNISKKSKIIGAFSLRQNMKIFQYKQHKFNVFNGIKTFCMLWVIFGHLFSVRIQNVINVLTITDQVQTPGFLIVLAAFYAVDVFFYIGGFLVAYSFLRNKMKSIMKYPLAILHRLLRFWPSYIMTMIIYYSLMMHTGQGPIWSKLVTVGQIQNCKTLWKPIIFLDNIIDGANMCLGWGWYLQNDMQIFILSIPILYLYNKKRNFAFITIWIIILFSLILNFYQVTVNKYVTVTHRSDFARWNDYFIDIYTKPWTRCAPYLYGLTLGLLYMQWIQEQKQKKDQKGFFGIIKQKMQNSRILKNSVQLFGIFIILFIIFIPRTLQLQHHWPQFWHSMYLTNTKLLFVMGISMLVTPSLLGIKNDFFFWLMDTKFFNFVSKISFWTYLIHYMVVQYICYIQKVDFYYDFDDILTIYVPVAIFSMIFGFIGTLLIQTPFAKLQKLLFQKDKKPKIAKQQTPYKGQDLLSQSVSSISQIQSGQNGFQSSSLKKSLLNKSEVIE